MATPTPQTTAAGFRAALQRTPPADGPQEVGYIGPVTISDSIDLAKLCFSHPIRVVDVTFEDFVDLAEAVFEKALRFENCNFNGGLRLRDVRVGGLFSLAGCTIKGEKQGFVDARRMRVDGLCDLSLVTSDVGLDFSHLIAKDDLRLDGIKLDARVKTKKDILEEIKAADARHLEEEMVGKALNLEGADIAKHVYIYAPADKKGTKRGAQVTGMMDLRFSVGGQVEFVAAGIHGQVVLQEKIHGMVLFSGCVLSNPGGLAVNMLRADVGGSVIFREKTQVTGQIDLRAKIGGGLEFQGTSLSNPFKTVLDMDAARVDGMVLFKDSNVLGKVDLRATVGSNVEFLATRLSNPGGHAVTMFAAGVGKSVFFDDGSHVTGQIDIRAKVGGNVHFRKTTIANPGGNAVDMGGADIAGSVFLRDGTQVTGGLDLRVKVGDNVEFRGATILNRRGTAVNMDTAEVGGVVRLGYQTFIVGRVTAKQAKLRNGLFTSDDGDVREFDLPQADKVKNLTLLGNLDLAYADICGPAQFHLVNVWGKIDAQHLTVHGDLDICGSVIGPSIGNSSFADRHAPNSGGTFAALQSRMARYWQHEEVARKSITASESRANFELVDIDPEPSLQNRPPLDFEMAEIHGRFWAKGTKLLGTVTLEDAEVAGEVNFDGAEVHGNLKLRSATVRGRVFADETETAAYPLVSGHVDLSYSTLAQVDMRFDKPPEDAAADAINWTPDTIDLTGATVSTLKLHGTPQRDDYGRLLRPWLLTEGLKFQQLDLAGLAKGKRPPLSARDWARQYVWLILVVSAFVLAAYHQCAVLMTAVAGYFAFVGAKRVMDRGVSFRRLGRWRRARPATPSPRPTTLFGRARAALVATASAVKRKATPLYRLILPRCGVHSAVLGLMEMTYPFSRSFYLLVEQWLRSAGDDVTANEVFHMRRRRESKATRRRPHLMPAVIPGEAWPSPGLGLQVWYWLVDFTAGFGVRTGRLLHLYVLLFLLNIGVFLNPESVERPLAYTQASKEHQAVVDEQKEDRRATKDGLGQEVQASAPYWSADGGTPMPDEWWVINSTFMASRVQVPFLAMVAENDWEPASRPMVTTLFGSITYEEYASLMMFVNLILLPLMLAGLTGFLKK